MPRWTPDDLAEFNRRRLRDHSHAVPTPEPELALCHEPVASSAGKAGGTTLFRVCVKSRRHRLLDPDNLCPKYVVDCLRYAGVLPDDTAEHVSLEVSQEKIGKKETECTEITVTKL